MRRIDERGQWPMLEKLDFELWPLRLPTCASVFGQESSGHYHKLCILFGHISVEINFGLPSAARPQREIR